MDYSRTPNVESSTLSRLLPYSRAWEQSVSSVERITLMKGFTSTLLSILEDGSVLLTNGHSMLMVATRMCLHLEEHPKRVGIMQQKMVTLLRGDSNDQAEAEFIRLALTGVDSAMRRVNESFGNWLENWLHELFLPTSRVSALLPSGIFVPTQLHTVPQLACHTTFQELRDSLNGYVTIWLEIM